MSFQSAQEFIGSDSDQRLHRRIRRLLSDLQERGIESGANPFLVARDHVGDAIASDRALRAELTRFANLWPNP